jgi:hypothetical protein
MAIRGLIKIKPKLINKILNWFTIKETDNPQSGKAAPYGSGYAKLKEETTSTQSSIQKIDQLPQGKLFNDAKNIEGVFKKSST